VRRKLGHWQFSVIHLFLVLSACAVLTPFVVSWVRKPREEVLAPKPPAKPAPQSVPQPVPMDQATSLKALETKPTPFEVVIEPNEVPVVELTHTLNTGEELRLLSTKRRIRSVRTGEISPDVCQNSLSLECTRRRGSSPEQIWSFQQVDFEGRIVGYSDPYGFLLCDDATPILGLVFFDEKDLHFAEIDLNKPASMSAPPLPWESFDLRHFVLQRFGDANWEPRFAIRNLKRESDGWSMEVGIKGETLLLKRTGYRQWVEVPSTEKTRTEAK
jgi:hypothetical protein